MTPKDISAAYARLTERLHEEGVMEVCVKPPHRIMVGPEQIARGQIIPASVCLYVRFGGTRVLIGSEEIRNETIPLSIVGETLATTH